MTGANIGSAWGVDQYTDDSNVRLTAVHAGLAAIGETVTIKARCAGPADSWAGSTRNGVTTEAYNNFWGYSYTLSSP